MTFRLTQRRLELLAALDDLGGEDRDLTAERIKMRAEVVAARVVEWADRADLEAGVDQIRLQWNMAVHTDLDESRHGCKPSP